MEKIQINLENYQKKGATSERAYWIDLTSKMLNQPFKQVLGVTRFLTKKEIESLYLKAKSWNTNPPALWWKLLKELKLTFDK